MTDVHASGLPLRLTPRGMEAVALHMIPRLLLEIEALTKYLPTLPELADADEALRALRHLRKQLESA